MTSRFYRGAIRFHILSGFFVLSSVILSSVPSGAQTSKSSPTTFSYSCCDATFVNTVYHPGAVMTLKWTPSAYPPSDYPRSTVTLSAGISGPFHSVASLKKAFGRSHPKLGVINSKALTVRLSDQKPAHPTSLIRIPTDASKGFYELTTTVKEGSVTTSGGSIIRIAP
jgi:hypothetical protein